MELTKKKKTLTFSLEEPIQKIAEDNPKASSTPINVIEKFYQVRPLATSTPKKKYLPEYLLYNLNSFDNKENVNRNLGPPRIGLFDQLNAEKTRMQNDMIRPLKPIENKINPRTSQNFDRNIDSNGNVKRPVRIQENFYNLHDDIGDCSYQFTDNVTGFYQIDRNIKQDLWITVFGFQPHNLTEVINFFSVYCGNILDKKYPPKKYNWIELKFELPHQVIKALKYNGKIINGSTMIGVVKSSSQNPELINWACYGNYDTTKPLSVNNSRMFMNWSTNPTQNVPYKSNGLMTKFFELIFGLQ